MLATVKSPYLGTFYGANIRDTIWFLVTDLTAANLEVPPPLLPPPRLPLFLPDPLLSLPNSPRLPALQVALDRRTWVWDVVFSVALSLAEAVHSLHAWSPVVIHANLRPSCILVDRAWSVKLVDLSHARFEGEVLEPLVPSVYQAPEVHTRALCSRATDSYSFGVILWELVARTVLGQRARPFAEHGLPDALATLSFVAAKQLRPSMPPQTPPPFVELITACWAHEPERRPGFPDIVRAIETLADMYRKQAKK